MFYSVHRIGVMFFFAFFGFFHSSLAPTVEIEVFGPKGLGFRSWNPFLNTLILLHPSCVTWLIMLYSREGKTSSLCFSSYRFTALVFTGFQGMEYYQAPFTISDSIYQLLSWFHVIIVLFLDHMWYSPISGHLTKEHHVGFEAAACTAFCRRERKN
uniref:Cytochrome c oxidase subunit 3 n=1 Tax=Salix viminalis TaxID=40686 RepID=A0A6N2KW73_SALVM